MDMMQHEYDAGMHVIHVSHLYQPHSACRVDFQLYKHSSLKTKQKQHKGRLHNNAMQVEQPKSRNSC